MSETYAGHTDAALRRLCAGAPEIDEIGPGADAAALFYEAARLALPAALDRVAALEVAVREALHIYDNTRYWEDERLGRMADVLRAALGEASHE